MRVARVLFGVALALGLLAILPAGALAKRHDRNHDRIPDRWEHRHHLSLKVKQTRRDQDRDGLNNLGEFRAQTNPHDADTDNDGLNDSQEHAGKVDSYDTQTGALTISLFGGGTVSGKVTGDTEFSCETEGDIPVSVHASHEDGDSERGDEGDQHGDNEQGDDEGDDEQGDDDQGDGGDNEGENGNCSAADLQLGAVIHEAELKLTGAGAVFTDIEIVVGP